MKLYDVSHLFLHERAIKMSADDLSFLPKKARNNVVRAWIRTNIEKKYNIRAGNDIISLIITFAYKQNWDGNCEAIYIVLIGDGWIGRRSLAIKYAYNVFTHGEYQFNTEDYDFEKTIIIRGRQYRVTIANYFISNDDSDYSYYWNEFIKNYKIFLLCYSVDSFESSNDVSLIY